MKLIKVATPEAVAVNAAEFVMNQIKTKPASVIGLPTGGTPVGLYAELAKGVKAKHADLSQIKTFNLDEYYGLAKDDPQSYYTFMKVNLYAPCGLRSDQTHIPSGTASDAEAEVRAYEASIVKEGGLDLQVLGIGGNGHIGFNEPGTDPKSRTHVVTLTQNTREANARFFASLDEVPTRAMTMGIQTILDAKVILMLVFGARKADILFDAFKGPVTINNPASFLQNHPDVIVIADHAAAARL
jgi:glucosamine-6-phosphate deaminase